MGEIEESKRTPPTGAGMSELARIPTHIEGLDENMQGEIPQGHICIVAGASGAMKSSLTFSICSAVWRDQWNLCHTRARQGFAALTHVQHGHEH